MSCISHELVSDERTPGPIQTPAHRFSHTLRTEYQEGNFPLSRRHLVSFHPHYLVQVGYLEQFAATSKGGSTLAQPVSH